MKNVIEDGLLEGNIVFQSTSYNCGPAALATVLNLIGICCSEQEIAKIAGTDETGTTMYGLMHAARKKGICANGMRMSISGLGSGDIVFLNLDGKCHYSVIAKINHHNVVLADPALGKIEISKNYFSKVYTGNALIMKKLDNAHKTIKWQKIASNNSEIIKNRENDNIKRN
jgi:predicted double-glycine peptidase